MTADIVEEAMALQHTFDDDANEESNARFRAVFENSSVGMAITSVSGEFISANRALCEMLGYPPGALDGVHFSEITHPEDQADSLDVLRMLGSGERAVAHWEKRYVKADGRTVCARISVVPVRDSQGNLSHFIAQIEDITQRREVEAELAASEHLFRQVFDAAFAGMALVDLADGRFLRVNPAGCQMLGYRERELLELTIQDVTHPDDRDASLARFHSVITGAVPSSRGQLRYLRRDGSTAHGIVSVALARGPDGEPLHVIANVVDVTEQVEAKKRLVDVLASKDQFIAAVSHEFRTPLTSVVGFAQLLGDDAADLSTEEQAELIRLIANESADLANIVDGLLLTARADMDTVTMARVPVDLYAQSAQVIETLCIGRGETRIQLAGEPIRVFGDPAKVRQILRNLLSNALKYGGDRIRVVTDGDGPHGRVRVADSGPGIPEEERERIFEPFQRAHDDSGLAPSLGLGLSISRRLARLMGGDLSYRREADESIFEFALPQA